MSHSGFPFGLGGSGDSRAFRAAPRLCALLILPTLLLAKENRYPLVATPLNLDLTREVASGHVTRKQGWFNDYDNAVLNQSSVIDFISNTTGQCWDKTPNGAELRRCASNEAAQFPLRNEYVIFHVVNWNGSTNPGLTAPKQNWYVYNSDPEWDYTKFTGLRVYGSKNVYLYTIHLNCPTNLAYEERYSIDEKSKTPAVWTHLTGVLQMLGLNSSKGLGGEIPSADRYYFWTLTINSVPSDLKITPEMVPVTGKADAAAQNQQVGGVAGPKEKVSELDKLAPPPTVPAPGADLTQPQQGKESLQTLTKSVTLSAITIDNEGLYHFDFSAGIPFTRISQLSYVQVSNSIAPANVNQQKVFALFDYYPVAVDIKNAILPKYPYLLTGVGVGSQPLQKALFGIGFGPLFANFYAGLLLNTQRVPGTWSCGDKTPGSSPAGTAFQNRTCPQFSFGLNVSVAGTAQAIKSKVGASAGK